MILSLTGFMGCGKSCVGRELAALTGWRLIDLDGWIESHEGRSVRAIFSEEGEVSFRKIETESLRLVLECESKGDKIGANSLNVADNLIISLGGGTLTSPEAESMVHEETFCVYLRAGVETLVYNLEHWPGDRPMLGDHPDRDTLLRRIDELMSSRSQIYERAAHSTIDIDGKDYQTVAAEIAGIVSEHQS